MVMNEWIITTTTSNNRRYKTVCLNNSGFLIFFKKILNIIHYKRVEWIQKDEFPGLN